MLVSKDGRRFYPGADIPASSHNVKTPAKCGEDLYYKDIRVFINY
jgi:hypothetical protein